MYSVSLLIIPCSKYCQYCICRSLSFSQWTSLLVRYRAKYKFVYILVQSLIQLRIVRLPWSKEIKDRAFSLNPILNFLIGIIAVTIVTVCRKKTNNRQTILLALYCYELVLNINLWLGSSYQLYKFIFWHIPTIFGILVLLFHKSLNLTSDCIKGYMVLIKSRHVPNVR